MARRLSLDARIGARTPADVLLKDLGQDGAASIRDTYRRTAGTVLLLERTAADLTTLAREEGFEAVFLKGLALQLTGVSAIGSRGIGDIDLLLPSRKLASYEKRLTNLGWRVTDQPDHEHQTPPIVSPHGVMVELHDRILGTRPAATAQSFRYEDLLKSGLARSAGTFQGLVPVDSVLFAHLVVHGIAQHGGSPGSYPLFRLVADVADVLDARGRGSFEGVFGLIERDVSREEFDALLELVERLCAGNWKAGLTPQAKAILDHFIAGTLDSEYRDALRLSFDTIPTDQPAWLQRAESVWRAVVLTRGQIDSIYGPPDGNLGYLGRQVWRPLDLLGRLWRYWNKGRAIRRRTTRRVEVRIPGTPPLPENGPGKTGLA
ncbi:MAG: nucleotidyltransferase family protein [Thermoanaerobaculia bacterium]|nr:nucleotidyltransferase family protein [Thermoanaerobaculia bacterium]